MNYACLYCQPQYVNCVTMVLCNAIIHPRASMLSIIISSCSCDLSVHSHTRPSLIPRLYGNEVKPDPDYVFGTQFSNTVSIIQRRLVKITSNFDPIENAQRHLLKPIQRTLTTMVCMLAGSQCKH